MITGEKPRSDAFVFFGATGDLAYKKIFPALQSMARRGKLDFPVIGVAKSGWGLSQFLDRARASVTEHGGLDEDAFKALADRLRYVDGEYGDLSTFRNLRRELDSKEVDIEKLESDLWEAALAQPEETRVDLRYSARASSKRTKHECLLGLRVHADRVSLGIREPSERRAIRQRHRPNQLPSAQADRFRVEVRRLRAIAAANLEMADVIRHFGAPPTTVL